MRGNDTPLEPDADSSRGEAGHSIRMIKALAEAAFKQSLAAFRTDVE